MLHNNRSIVISFGNGVLISIVSYTLYALLWIVLDYQIISSDLSIKGVVLDFLLCSFFSVMSLIFCSLMVRFLRIQDDLIWTLSFSGLLFIFNNIVAIGLSNVGESILNTEYTRIYEIQDYYTSAMLSTFVSSIYIIIKLVNDYRIMEEKTKTVEISLMEEKEKTLSIKLGMLRSQINPHFLFNNFSVLYSLIEGDKHKAQTFLLDLSQVYRHIIKNLDVDLVCVKEEIEMLESYIALLYVRFEKTLNISISDRLRQCDGRIPPLSLQLLLENAIKHNQMSEEKPLCVKFEMLDDKIIVNTEKQLINLNVESFGIGNTNIVDRYQLISNQRVEFIEDENFYSAILPVL